MRSEEACALRHGRPYCVVAYESSAQDSPERDLAALVSAATRCLRATDSVGFLSGRQVGVLLPFADRARAHSVVQRIGASPELAGRPIHCTIHAFSPSYRNERAVEPARPCVAPPPDPREGPLPGRPDDELYWDRRGVAVLLSGELPRWKRATDVFLASAGLVVLAPLLLLIAAVILVSSGRPILYRQWRTGRGLRRFRILKFRTMRPDAHPDRGWERVRHLNEMSGPLFKSDCDPRVFRIGRLLRKTSLDELPQLWNVLKGEMTLVGPRALSPQPGKYEPWQLRRFDVTPGIACSWQVGHRRETDFVDWMRHDLRYVDQGGSLSSDVRLLGAVLGSVVRCAGGR